MPPTSSKYPEDRKKRIDAIDEEMPARPQWDKVSPAKLDLMIDKAEKQVAGTHADMEGLDKRRTHIGAALITGIIGLGGVMLANYPPLPLDLETHTEIFLAALCTAIYLLRVGKKFFIGAVTPQDFELPGISPSVLWRDGIHARDLPWFKGTILRNYERTIKGNTDRLSQISAGIKQAISGLVQAPLLFATVVTLWYLIPALFHLIKWLTGC